MSYGFQGRLSAEFPSQLIIDSTEICNLACVHCPHPKFKASSAYGGRCLDQALCFKAVDEVRVSGRGIVQYIRFTGEGEPLIHPNLFEMLTYAVRHSQTTVTLTTNGTLLDARRMARLLETGVHIVDISIDAFTSETYEKIRVNGVLEETRGNILRLLKAAKTGGYPTKVIVSYVEQPLNIHETSDFQRFWKENGADYVVVRRLHSNAGASIETSQELQRRAPVQRFPCLYPWERISLTPRGELIYCPQDWVRGSTVADFRSTTIRDAWHGEFYKHLRAAHLANDFKAHAFCGNCMDWQHTRWPGEGRSYADMIQEFKECE